MSASDKLPKSLFASSPWEGSRDPLWPASTIIIHRNLSKFPFPHKMTQSEREQVLALVEGVLTPLLKNPKVLTADTLTSHDKEFLFEHFLLNEGFEKFDPGHALIVDDSASFLGLINVEDHLHLHFTSSSLSLEELWKEASAIEKGIGKELDFAFNSRFGYLTSDPTICGTGVIVQTYLHLPTLVQVDSGSGLSEERDESVVIQGLGSDGEFLADLVLLENRFKLGTTEKDLIDSVGKASSRLLEKEKSLRKGLNEEQTAPLKDKVSRAFGLLSHSYRLQIHEALSALSLLHLAGDLGWMKGGHNLLFRKLFFEARRGHLTERLKGGDLSQEILCKKRADFLHDQIKSSQLSL